MVLNVERPRSQINTIPKSAKRFIGEAGCRILILPEIARRRVREGNDISHFLEAFLVHRQF